MLNYVLLEDSENSTAERIKLHDRRLRFDYAGLIVLTKTCMEMRSSRVCFPVRLPLYVRARGPSGAVTFEVCHR